MAQTIWYIVGFKAYQINVQSHDHSIIMTSSAQDNLVNIIPINALP